jgi:phospholipase C
MKENHSYDNYFGMLGRGDGFILDEAGLLPVNTNPDRHGQPVRAWHLPVPFNPSFGVSQTWDSSHLDWGGEAMDGFVTTTGSHDPMGYLDGTDLPWYFALAGAFGIGDRYFSSCLAPTFPNRRFLQAATAYGLASQAAALPPPPAFVR